MRALRYRRWWLAGGWALVLTVVYLSLTSRPPSVGLALGDKWGHVLAYFVLMAWFCGVVVARARPALGAALIAMGVGLEIVQGATGLRVYEVWDMVANALGVALGWGAARLGLDRWSAWVEARLGAARSTGHG